MKLAVIMPSRGLIFSRTIEDVLREVRSFRCDWNIFFSHSRPIPECFNEALTEALKDDYTHFWFVEEDMILPNGILFELYNNPAQVVTADYPVTGGMCITRDNDGSVLYAGTGCLLVERSVLTEIGTPVFDTKHMYKTDGSLIGVRSQDELDSIYGQHDIHFYLTLKKLEIMVGVTDLVCGQWRITNYGERERNDGFHKIAPLDHTK